MWRLLIGNASKEKSGYGFKSEEKSDQGPMDPIPKGLCSGGLISSKSGD